VYICTSPLPHTGINTYGGEKMSVRFWWGNLREGHHLEVPGLDGRIIMKWIFNK